MKIFQRITESRHDRRAERRAARQNRTDREPRRRRCHRSEGHRAEGHRSHGHRARRHHEDQSLLSRMVKEVREHFEATARHERHADAVEELGDTYEAFGEWAGGASQPDIEIDAHLPDVSRLGVADAMHDCELEGRERRGRRGRRERSDGFSWFRM